MRIITQISLFDDTLNENLGDLERLQKVLANLPDEELIQKLKTIRGLEKMKMFLMLTFIIQLASAKAKIESGTTSGLAKHCA